jgi:hypothetical protein
VGEPIRWSVSVDKETDAIAEILQRTYAEYVGSNRSRLVQFLFKRFHRMAGNLPAALEHEQGINQAILSQEITTLNNLSQEFPVPQAGQRKPPVRASRVPSDRRREINGVSRRSCVGVRWACLPPFPGKVRPFKSNSFRQVA